MKQILFLISSLAIASFSYGQFSTLNENMNSTCPTGNFGPNGWVTINPISTPDPEGKWTCDPASGRAGTPGVSCTGLYGSSPSYHLDTSTLVSPSLNLSGYTTIYVNFDTKTTNFNLGARFEILVSADSTMDLDTAVLDTATVYNRTTAAIPLFSMDDETDWVTHQVDLTPYKHISPLYLGFRYVSEAGTNGSEWFLDNILVTTVELPVGQRNLRANRGLTVNGTANNGALNLIVNVPATGNYDFAIYDMTGRNIYKEKMLLQSGTSTKKINDLVLPTGVYLLKLGNEGYFGSAKVQSW